MSLADAMLRVVSDAGLVLTLADRAVSPTRKADWRTRSGAAVSDVTFGPYRDRVEADGVGVVIGGDIVRVIPLGGTVTLLPGMTLAYEATVAAADV